MKKLTTLLLIASLATSGAALAKSHDMPYQGGGFSGPASQTVTVSQAQRMADDIRVTLKGYIVQQLDHKDYLFKDETGTIQVEIKNHIWNGVTITPEDLVEISGEIDKDWTSVEIEVKQIRKLSQ